MLLKDSQRTTDRGAELENFLAGPGAANMAPSLPTMTFQRHIKGPTYLPRIHIYRDKYLSSL
jgi:hypothetical protein